MSTLEAMKLLQESRVPSKQRAISLSSPVDGSAASVDLDVITCDPTPLLRIVNRTFGTVVKYQQVSTGLFLTLA